ncbi:MAG TPA: secretin and TonB N-terminal domain-containing protein [Syntrophales bacterium]|nr:secretin and TonB N-terminal domain-containing protein [Syntrophales bacterium]HOM06327.1 secretin and TonB N-terminal domain-containing protein [Syntrophales bacterium]HPQ05692.1 secretin and TonB N-terminal domain-containing protein [Syntrophales bacterium]HRS86771.1 secretin and TonB N-terminal domain-containing protein [Syntrophales bacterium]HRV41992.1 secretin and TonB N-terminal domain-containing protein [Syntrophales bacterium]
MKRIMTWTVWLCFLAVVLGTGTPAAQTAPEAAGPAPQAGYLEDVRFEKGPGWERVILVLSRQPGAEVDSKKMPPLVIRLSNTFIPEELRRPQGEGKLAAVLRAVPAQEALGASPRASVRIDLKEALPFSVRQEANNLLVEFNTAALAKAEATPADKETYTPVAVAAGGLSEKEKYRGEKISLSFQEADFRGVLQQLARIGGKNIAFTSEVQDKKGTVTMDLRDVPWDQAFDTILYAQGLTKKEEGNTIIVATRERLKKDEEERIAAEDRRKKAEEAAKEAEIKSRQEKGKLRQILIEAKILEVSDTFTRDIGVRWGAGFQGNLSNDGAYSLGLVGGTGPITYLWNQSATQTAPALALTNGISLTKNAMAVNLSTAAFTPTVGVIMGGANAVLNAQISALETTNKGRVLSSPRVVTQDTQKAVIEQGEEIPVTTPGTSTTPPTTTYKPAVLRLTVTPEIKPDNRILLTVVAQNDRPNRAEKDVTTGNYPVFTSKVDSRILVKDGDTLVIGGIVRTDDSLTLSGVPWLSKIPVLGWLFKYQSVQKIKRELLVVITPRIMDAGGEGKAKI